ncbi:MAG: aminotransferase class I/II-fold pyridoxal phosphate-dependent enzyme [Bacteroidales bacterium]
MEEPGMSKLKKAARTAAGWHSENLQRIRNYRFDTIATHGIYSMQEALDFNQGAIIEPLYLSTSQGYRNADEMEAALSYEIPTWCYSRIANPTNYYLEGVLALLESYGSDAEATCCVTSSGMSAIQSTVDPLLVSRNGEPVNFVAPPQVYGGTFQQFAIRKDKERGIEWRVVKNPLDIDSWAELIDSGTRFIYGEMPSNPGLAFFDLKKVVELAHAHGIPVIIDATIATPALMRPMVYGADIVIHSITKTITSGGFAIGGAVISRKNMVADYLPDEMRTDYAGWLKLWPNRDNGLNLSPFNALMTLNDLRSLRSKMDLFSRNTMKVAEFLQQNPHVTEVAYPGLKNHPLHQLASQYLRLVDSDEETPGGVNRYGHLMSFRVKEGPEATRRVFDAFRLIWRATDLGRIKSVATIPAISTHSQQGEEGRELAGIPADLIRLCVGGEHPDDVINDLDQALAVLEGKKYAVKQSPFSGGGASSAILQSE